MTNSGPTPFREPVVLLVLVCSSLLLSGLSPQDRFTWWLEALPVLIGIPVLMATTVVFPLTSLAYRLLTVHAGILLVGAHYTYAEVPLGYWVQDLFHLARNHYDRLGHFAQGFVPAILVREILLRRTPIRHSGWLLFLTSSVCLAFSALYELFEWITALATGEVATAFLGTQGDVWDTQWDMCLALVGSLAAQLLLRASHDGQIIHVTAQRS
jgi:putative membrane protein